MSYSTLIAFSVTFVFVVFSTGNGKVLNAASDTINDYVVQVQDKVNISMYYETLCDGCVAQYANLKNDVIGWGSFGGGIGLENLNMFYHPFGNGKMYEKDGKTIIECQHGPDECYGNMIHACAMDILKNASIYIPYNNCTIWAMRDRTNIADFHECATTFQVDDKPIIDCATSDRGFQLLKYHGEETVKLHLDFVPYVFINGKVANHDILKDYICAEFIVKPKACLPNGDDKVLSHKLDIQIDDMKCRSEPC